MGNQTSAEECARQGGTCIDGQENGYNLLDPCVLPASRRLVLFQAGTHWQAASEAFEGLLTLHPP